MSLHDPIGGDGENVAMPIDVVLPDQHHLSLAGVQRSLHRIGPLDEELPLVTSSRGAVKLGKRNNPR